MNPISLNKVFNPNPGWYRGDFHAHTNFSDGYHNPTDLGNVARQEGLDFFTITDHNTTNAYPHCGAPDDMLIIPGIEVTLKEGHYNVFGLEQVPSRLEPICAGPFVTTLKDSNETVNQIMQESKSQGLLNSINHPLLTPWAWLDNRVNLENLHCLEIYNDPSWPDNKIANPQAVQLWTRWLNAGYRITAIGGTDYHRPQPKPDENKPAERLSLPSTYVYAAQLSGAAILQALRQHRAYMSIGPTVTFSAQHQAAIYMMGDDLGEIEGQLEFTISVDSNQTIIAQLIKNGTVVAETTQETSILSWSDTVEATQSAWYRLDVMSPAGEILVVTNPIFVGPRIEPPAKTYGDLVT